MKQLAEAKETELFWEQPKASQRNFFLRSEKYIFAQLEFDSAFSKLAEATSPDEQWIFKRVGVFSTQVKVQQADSEIILASYYPSWIGSQGKIQLLNGEEYDWNVANFFGTKFAIYKEDGNELITYLSGSRSKKFSNLFKREAQVVIAPEAWQIKELALLMLLGWYLVILHKEDSAAVAASGSIASLY